MTYLYVAPPCEMECQDVRMNILGSICLPGVKPLRIGARNAVVADIQGFQPGARWAAMVFPGVAMFVYWYDD
jgi:hypothetical protein